MPPHSTKTCRRKLSKSQKPKARLIIPRIARSDPGWLWVSAKCGQSNQLFSLVVIHLIGLVPYSSRDLKGLMGFPLSGFGCKGIVWYDHPILWRPIRDPGLADNFFPGQHPPTVRITGVGTVVSQDKVFIRGYSLRAPGVCTGIG